MSATSMSSAAGLYSCPRRIPWQLCTGLAVRGARNWAVAPGRPPTKKTDEICQNFQNRSLCCAPGWLRAVEAQKMCNRDSLILVSLVPAQNLSRAERTCARRGAGAAALVHEQRVLCRSFQLQHGFPSYQVCPGDKPQRQPRHIPSTHAPSTHARGTLPHNQKYMAPHLALASLKLPRTQLMPRTDNPTSTTPHRLPPNPQPQAPAPPSLSLIPTIPSPSRLT